MIIKNEPTKKRDILEDSSRISVVEICAWLTSFNSSELLSKIMKNGELSFRKSLRKGFQKKSFKILMMNKVRYKFFLLD